MRMKYPPVLAELREGSGGRISISPVPVFPQSVVRELICAVRNIDVRKVIVLEGNPRLHDMLAMNLGEKFRL